MVPPCCRMCSLSLSLPLGTNRLESSKQKKKKEEQICQPTVHTTKSLCPRGVLSSLPKLCFTAVRFMFLPRAAYPQQRKEREEKHGWVTVCAEEREPSGKLPTPVRTYVTCSHLDNAGCCVVEMIAWLAEKKTFLPLNLCAMNSCSLSLELI